MKMFEIGLHNEATTTAVVDMKEIPISGLNKVFELAEVGFLNYKIKIF